MLIGGGHSHVTVLRKLAMNPVPGLQITLISPDVQTAYSGMLPGVVAGHYQPDDIHIDLVPLCRFAGARFFQTKVTNIDPGSQVVQCEGRPDVSFDILSIDIGITPSLDDVPGASENVIAVKPIGRFLDKWDRFLQRALNDEVKSVGVVGAGAGGVELCLAIRHRLQQEFENAGKPNHIACHLFSDGDTLLPGFDAGVQQRFLRQCERQAINLHTNFRVRQIDQKTLLSTEGEEIPLNEIFWVTSAASQGWLAGTGLELDENGFIAVRETLQTVSHDNIFAVGDIAHVLAHPRPKAGVFAVRQGPPLEKNLRRLVLGKPAKPFKPQKEFLTLISTGDQYAVASRNNKSFEGKWVWHWKDWIDRRFMKRFNHLPDMDEEPRKGLMKEFDSQMQCGGCGSKVGADILNQVLSELNVGGPSLDDAATYHVAAHVANHVAADQIMLHTVDGFRSFIDDPYLFAQVATHHALSDIYAMGAKPVTVLAMVTLPYAKPDKTKALLKQLLAGTLHVLEEEQVQLVGGHTGEGAELSLGFAVNGVADESTLLTKHGMQAGDALVLTKPLGTGALFAADMQHKARGRWINEALRNMCQSNRQAVDCIKAAGATSCTDITGFGLAGHLKEMLGEASLSVSLDLDALPVLPGSVDVIHAFGITSTLHEANRASAGRLPIFQHDNYELLFDPQTAGGLLASVPSASATRCVESLHAAGYLQAGVIGHVVESEEPGIVVNGRESGADIKR